MLYVAIGLIIFFVSFFIAFVNLIRELGRKTNVEDTEGADFFSPDVGEEVVYARDDFQENDSFVGVAETNLQNGVSAGRPNLEETVPFPWDTQTELNSVIQNNQENYLTKNKSIQIPIPEKRKNLAGVVSLSDLKGKN